MQTRKYCTMNMLSSTFLSQITERPQSLLPPCAQSANSNIQYTPRLTYHQEWYSIFLTTIASETCSSRAAGVAASSWLFLLCLGRLQHLMWQGKVICYRVLNHLLPPWHICKPAIFAPTSHTHTHLWLRADGRVSAGIAPQARAASMSSY